ncbi:hypothetical protein ILUMI_23809 [Ignelater luminosus]|uniref:H15 domain-containing protein n=1 Tax=Ignelater luminosus TaxID=2038154 RepID=A0A8K0CA97_IGNLU|nr:hypothetical protein ILUMI_23809 [Ignelater luminosus]
MLQKDKLPPALKSHVIQAIASLQERRGSTTREILNQIKLMIRRSPRYKERSRNLMLQIQRALRYCVADGLLSHQAGRYKLDKNIEELKGTKKRKRRSSSIATSSLLSGSSVASSAGGSKTSASGESRNKYSGGETKGRRRRKGKKPKGKKKGKKGKKRRRRSVSHSEDSKQSEDFQNPPDQAPSEQSQTDSELPSTSFSGERKRLRGGRSNAVVERDANSYPDCGSPDCLCNAKQEQNDPIIKSEDDYNN